MSHYVTLSHYIIFIGLNWMHLFKESRLLLLLWTRFLKHLLKLILMGRELSFARTSGEHNIMID